MGGRYKAVPVVIDGLRFASKKEAARYGELCLLQKAGEIKDLECQPAFKVQVGGLHFCTYTADFRYRKLHHPWSSVWVTVIEEVKSSGSRKDAAYRLRRKAAELFHGVEVTEVVR